MGRAEDAVCLHGQSELFFFNMLQEFPDPRVEERFASRQFHAVEPEGLCLFDDRFEKPDIQGRVHPLAVLKLRLNPAVTAGEVASLRQVKIDTAEGIIQSAALEERFA
jgi:hypothetical protein